LLEPVGSSNKIQITNIFITLKVAIFKFFI
jgi:hypothetical protein